MAWAACLLLQPNPKVEPGIVYQPHSFFVENVCYGKECNAVGWYNDSGIIYLDDRLEDIMETSPLARSIVVHEFVHYIQDLSGEYPEENCEVFNKREDEAYAIQDRYWIEVEGMIPMPRSGRTVYGCNKDGTRDSN